MRLCGRCRAAENPRGNLKFVESPEGVLCEKCYDTHYSVAKVASVAPTSESLVVILCPACRGKHHAVHGKQCSSCCGYGSVRIPANALAVYRPRRAEEPSEPELLMEGGDGQEESPPAD